MHGEAMTTPVRRLPGAAGGGGGGVNLRVVFFGFVCVMAFANLPLLFASLSSTPPATVPATTSNNGGRFTSGPPRTNAVGDKPVPTAAGPTTDFWHSTSGAADVVRGEQFVLPARVFAASTDELEAAAEANMSSTSNAAADSDDRPKPPPYTIPDGMTTLTNADIPFLAAESASGRSDWRRVRFVPREQFDVSPIPLPRRPGSRARSSSASAASLRATVMVAASTAAEATRIHASLCKATALAAAAAAAAGASKPIELMIMLQSAHVAEAKKAASEDSTDDTAGDCDGVASVTLLVCSPRHPGLSGALPTPWDVVPDGAAAAQSDAIVFLGPGVDIAATSATDALVEAMRDALWDTSVGGVGTPGIVGCAALRRFSSGGGGAGRLETLSLGARMFEQDHGAAVFGDVSEGFPMNLDEEGYASPTTSATAASPGVTVVAPSPLCFAARRELVKDYWRSTSDATAHQAHASLPIQVIVDGPRFVSFASESEQTGAPAHNGGGGGDPLSVPVAGSDASTSAQQHAPRALGDFARFCLRVGHLVVSDALGQSPTAKALYPFPIVQGVAAILDAEGGPSSDQLPTSFDAMAFEPMSGRIPPKERAAIAKWVAVLVAPASSSSVVPSIIWDTFCIKCFGFSNEVMHFGVPLEGRVPIRLRNSPDCFCHGTPTSFAASLRRLAMEKQFEVDHRNNNNHQAASSRPPVLWVSHKDPGSFPTRTGYTGLGGRPEIVIGRGMYEFNKVPGNWRGKDALVDEVWVPCRYIRYVFEQAGFKKEKLHIMPEPIDTKQFDPAAVAPYALPVRHLGWQLASNRPGDVSAAAVEASTKVPVIPAAVLAARSNFKFLAIFKWESRKAWDVLLRAFFEAFLALPGGHSSSSSSSPRACSLYMVSYVYGQDGRSPSTMIADAEAIADAIIDELRRKQHHDDDVNNRKKKLPTWPDSFPHIEIISEQLSEAELVRLYRSVDAFVMPTRGEGWGLPIIQAMAMGLPTIATNWSGNTDFMTPETSYLLPLHGGDDGLRPVPADSGYGAAPGKMWAEPSEPDLRRLMRHVAAHPEEAARVGRRARAHVVHHYSGDAIAQLVIKRSIELSERRAEEEESRAGAVKDQHHAFGGRQQKLEPHVESRFGGGGRSGADLLLEGRDKSLLP